jgi:hypothetical protein
MLQGVDEPLANVGSTEACCREWLAGDSRSNLVSTTSGEILLA